MQRKKICFKEIDEQPIFSSFGLKSLTKDSTQNNIKEKSKDYFLLLQKNAYFYFYSSIAEQSLTYSANVLLDPILLNRT